MELASILWVLLSAITASAVGIALGYFVESILIDRSRFERKAHETADLLAFAARASRFEGAFVFLRTLESPKGLLSLSSDARRAIGLGLITKEEAAAAGSDSLAQSNLAFGLVLPISFILYTMAFRLQFHFVGFIGIAALVLASNAALVIAGVDRLYSYRLGLQSLILGRFEKQLIDSINQQQERRG
jgi:hypothetical protein